MISEKKFLKVVDEVSAEGCYCHGNFCTFRTIIEHQHTDIRLLIQLQCILKFRYEESERQGEDIGSKAEMKWFESGLAEEFAKVYNDELSFKEIYSRTLINYNPITGKVENKNE